MPPRHEPLKVKPDDFIDAFNDPRVVQSLCAAMLPAMREAMKDLMSEIFEKLNDVVVKNNSNTKIALLSRRRKTSNSLNRTLCCVNSWTLLITKLGYPH